MSNYRKDYEKSIRAEREFEDLLHQAIPDLKSENTQNKGYYPNFDVSTTSTTTGQVTRYEIKHNDCYLSGNVVIENCRIIDHVKHPSGLALSQSDYYVFKFECDTNFYLIPTNRLRELVESKDPKKYFVIDKNGFMLYIYPKDYFTSQCFKL